MPVPDTTNVPVAGGGAGGNETLDLGNDLDLEIGDETPAAGDEGDGGTGDQQIDDQQPDGQQPDGQEEPPAPKKEAPKKDEDPDTAEFQGAVSNRLRSLIKQAPELGSIFKKYPAVQAQWEAVTRRDFAYRDVFPTVSEAREMRAQFPNGKADVQVLLDDVKELENVDRSFDFRNDDGVYEGHPELIKNFFERDRGAAVALFRELPKHWAQLDSESYNDVMGKVVAATFAARGIPEFLDNLVAEAADGEFAKPLKQLKSFVDSYFAEKPKPSEEQQRLDREKSSFNKTRENERKEKKNQFMSSFVSESLKLQNEVIGKNQAISKLMTLKAVSNDKKQEILKKIRANGEAFLKKSPSFMRGLIERLDKNDMQAVSDWQRSAWSQQWFLNKMVRQVLNQEVPHLIRGTRGAARRTGPGTQQKPVTGDKQRSNTPKGPHQIGGRWYKADGTPFSTAEILAGKHQAQ